jgi:3-deoxy-7-phosphoheptulonate synthase
MPTTADLHVVDTRPLLPPATLLEEFPLTEAAADVVATTRERIRALIEGRERRLLAVVGPCSIHDPEAAVDYAHKLLRLRRDLAPHLEVVMRVYFEKPRTTTGWKGLINDPHLDGSFDINTGLRRARRLLVDLAAIGMPAATELLDPIIPQYLADVIAWTAIGARTTESQTHREMASGLSMPVGFKNGTDGSIGTAVNAMLAAAGKHHFLGVDRAGRASIVATTGNPDCHLVLRGGKNGPNYDTASVAKAAAELAKAKVGARMMVDCSHDNCAKDHEKQAAVCAAVADQVRGGSPHLLGVMVESHLVAGRQNICTDRTQMTYGQSITDPCVDFATTERMLRHLAEAVSASTAAVAAAR